MPPEIDRLEPGSSTQRGGLTHQAIEDYLKSIYALAQTESPVSTSRLAEAREVKPASVTGMIKRLAELHLVHYEKHRGVTLTPAGEKIALEVIRHHRLIELYLIEALGFTWDEVHEQADILEHVISEKLEERIAAALGHPQFDPHGAPIPSKTGDVVRVDHQPLTDLPLGTAGRISRIADDTDSDLLRYLAEHGLRPGVVVALTATSEGEALVTVQVEGVAQQIELRAAQAVLVIATALPSAAADSTAGALI